MDAGTALDLAGWYCERRYQRRIPFDFFQAEATCLLQNARYRNPDILV
jgi:hypothetical protein